MTGPSSGPRARVVVLAGPSGAGKSRLARRLHAAYAWPVVNLDEFYRDGGDPALPCVRLGTTTVVDWDDPRSWDPTAAVDALRTLVDTGAAVVPCYDIPTSRTVGSAAVAAPAGALVLAEGIFAAEIIGPLRDEELLHSAWCIRQNRWVTFARRLVRDLAERRKPPVVLLRRGVALCRAEPRIVARMERLGAVCVSPAEAERAVAPRS